VIFRALKCYFVNLCERIKTVTGFVAQMSSFGFKVLGKILLISSLAVFSLLRSITKGIVGSFAG
jgi:hypothetical protein